MGLFNKKATPADTGDDEEIQLTPLEAIDEQIAVFTKRASKAADPVVKKSHLQTVERLKKVRDEHVPSLSHEDAHKEQINVFSSLADDAKKSSDEEPDEKKKQEFKELELSHRQTVKKHKDALAKLQEV